MVPDTPALLTITCRPPKCSTAVVTRPADLVDIGHVGFDEQRVVTEVRGQRRAGVAVDVADQHLRALGREPARQALAQPRCAAGDDRDLARRVRCSPEPAGPFSVTSPRKSSSSSLTADGCSICGQWPARSTTAGTTVAESAWRSRPPTPRGSSLSHSALDHQGRHGDALVRDACSTAAAAARVPACETWRRPTPPTRRARCSTRSAAARTRRRRETPGRRTAPRRSARMPESVAS